jgi:hypothetical protein
MSIITYCFAGGCTYTSGSSCEDAFIKARACALANAGANAAKALEDAIKKCPPPLSQ